ncbi:hypothetical protein ACFPL7_01610 [Dongia soli]|uniref:Lipoprotein n=1 Tax=Dongia soli TaxID=600628 RepID=A0ABU5EF05_9PROT|nr:hypothetical protein [Dongia soli]MDY0884196.1 hypothetical protein [Dongia soli]
MIRKALALLAVSLLFTAAACDKEATQKALAKQLNANERNGGGPSR